MMFPRKYAYASALLLFLLVPLSFCARPGPEQLHTTIPVFTPSQTPETASLPGRTPIPAKNLPTPTWTATDTPGSSKAIPTLTG